MSRLLLPEAPRSSRLSQVTAALAGQTGQPVSVAVRTPASSSTVSYRPDIPQTSKAVVSQQQQQLVNNVQQQQVINAINRSIISSQQLGVLQQQLVNSQPLGLRKTTNCD